MKINVCQNCDDIKEAIAISLLNSRGYFILTSNQLAIILSDVYNLAIKEKGKMQKEMKE